MKFRMHLFAFASVFGVLSLAGCGGDSPTAATASNSTATSSTTGETSSATVVSGAGTEPAQVVAIFLDSLRSGDEEAANGVLTERARQELAKTPYEMQPLGTPEGKFDIGRVGYPYDDKTVALVECKWVEPPAPGENPLSMDIVCEVRKEAPGWRISGLVATVPNSEDTLVLDFEDAASLQATLDSATRAPQAVPASTTQFEAGTQVPAQTASGPTQLPPASDYPTLPNSGAAETPAPATNTLPELPSYPQ